MATSKLSPSKVPGKKAGPNGSFPVGDPKHARLAIGGATRSERAGNISPGEEAKIKAAARKELDKGDWKGKGKGKWKGKSKPGAPKNRGVPDFAAGQKTFGRKSWGAFSGGNRAPGLGLAADDDAPEVGE